MTDLRLSLVEMTPANHCQHVVHWHYYLAGQIRQAIAVLLRPYHYSNAPKDDRRIAETTMENLSQAIRWHEQCGWLENLRARESAVFVSTSPTTKK